LGFLHFKPALWIDPGKTLTQYAHRIRDQEEGLFQRTIYFILQTRDGFLSLGTRWPNSIQRCALHEFDGGGEGLFQHSLIRAFIEDGERNLWVASIGSGVTRISSDGTVTRNTKKQGLPSDNVFCLASDSSSRIWKMHKRGISAFGPRASSRIHRRQWASVKADSIDMRAPS
jgi:ligand-binding sensor domain-containing protein